MFWSKCCLFYLSMLLRTRVMPNIWRDVSMNLNRAFWEIMHFCLKEKSILILFVYVDYLHRYCLQIFENMYFIQLWGGKFIKNKKYQANRNFLNLGSKFIPWYICAISGPDWGTLLWSSIVCLRAFTFSMQVFMYCSAVLANRWCSKCCGMISVFSHNLCWWA